MTLDRYLAKQFLPVFLVAVSMFVLLLLLIDLFMNLARYLSYEVSPFDVLRVCLLYLPKSFSYALPVSLLFAAAYTLGELFARNELTSVFASGIPFWRFTAILLVIGFMASIFAFFFDDIVVIPTLRMKNELSRVLLRQQRSEFQSDIVVKAQGGQLIYAVDYFDSDSRTMYGVQIIHQDENGGIVSMIRAQRGTWLGEYWEFISPVIYEWTDDGFMRYRNFVNNDEYREEPDTFRRNLVNVEELPFLAAGYLVQDLRASVHRSPRRLPSPFFIRRSFLCGGHPFHFHGRAFQEKHTSDEPSFKPSLGGGLLCYRDDHHDDGAPWVHSSPDWGVVSGVIFHRSRCFNA
jgi:lipopolysaccharide export system permease protein